MALHEIRHIYSTMKVLAFDIQLDQNFKAKLKVKVLCLEFDLENMFYYTDLDVKR